MRQGKQFINGTEYVYMDEPFWDSKKQRGSHKRTYIGKNVEGIFIPNKNYALKCNLRRSAVADAFSSGRPAVANGC